MRFRLALLTLFASLAFTGSASAFGGADFTKTRYGVDYLAVHALIQVACPGGTQSTDRVGDFSLCTGFIEVTRGGRTIAYAPLALRTNDRITQRVPVQKRSARNYLRRHRSMGVHLKMVTHDGRGNFATNERDATLYDDFHDVL